MRPAVRDFRSANSKYPNIRIPNVYVPSATQPNQIIRYVSLFIFIIILLFLQPLQIT